MSNCYMRNCRESAPCILLLNTHALFSKNSSDQRLQRRTPPQPFLHAAVSGILAKRYIYPPSSTGTRPLSSAAELTAQCRNVGGTECGAELFFHEAGTRRSFVVYLKPYTVIIFNLTNIEHPHVFLGTGIWTLLVR
jgi:hypothetical protein